MGSCPEGCCQYKHKDERRVVFCTECKFREDCSKTVVLTKRDPVLELNTYEYHRVKYCSVGIKEE